MWGSPEIWRSLRAAFKASNGMSATTDPGQVALIPARSGSKRLPGKNLLPLGGHPLIAWTIRAALEAKCFKRIIVSTDSPAIGDMATRYGAEVPFLRPAALSTDQATTVDVVLHALETLEAQTKFAATDVCVLQPTSPYRTSKDIQESYELYRKKSASSVISVAACSHPPVWAHPLGPDRSMDDFLDRKYVNKRSQDLPVYYRINGAIYWCSSELVRHERTLFPDKNGFAFEMDELRSVDIDTRLDFEFAEFLLERGYVARF
jgi:CMP-N,N'-diacetyllegionaminic acid synthase